nr:hypothetical protein [Tanacetum cinerariifolium]
MSIVAASKGHLGMGSVGIKGLHGVTDVQAMAKVKRVNDQALIQALVDKKKVIIMKDIIRIDLRFDDAKGTACLFDEAILKDWRAWEVSHDESVDEDHVPTPSSDLLPSGEDSYTLNELMVFYTSLQEQVFALQEAKDAQSKEITALKKKGRKNDDEMFRLDDLSREKVVLDNTTGEHKEQIIEDVSTVEPITTAGEVVTTIADKVSAALTTYVTEDEITMAQALVALNSTKPKVVVQEQEDKGKAKIIEPEVPIKKKDQIRMDKDTQAMMKDGSLLAERLQAREREELSKVQKARLVKDRFKKEKPVDEMDNLLFKTLKTMFEHHVEDVIWIYQQGLAKVKNRKLYESCGVYCITMQSTIYYLLVEKVYLLTRNILHQLWSDVRLQVDHDVEMAYDLLKFIKQ